MSRAARRTFSSSRRAALNVPARGLRWSQLFPTPSAVTTNNPATATLATLAPNPAAFPSGRLTGYPAICSTIDHRLIFSCHVAHVDHTAYFTPLAAEVDVAAGVAHPFAVGDHLLRWLRTLEVLPPMSRQALDLLPLALMNAATTFVVNTFGIVVQVNPPTGSAPTLRWPRHGDALYQYLDETSARQMRFIMEAAKRYGEIITDPALSKAAVGAASRGGYLISARVNLPPTALMSRSVSRTTSVGDGTGFQLTLQPPDVGPERTNPLQGAGHNAPAATANSGDTSSTPPLGRQQSPTHTLPPGSAQGSARQSPTLLPQRTSTAQPSEFAARTGSGHLDAGEETKNGSDRYESSNDALFGTHVTLPPDEDTKSEGSPEIPPSAGLEAEAREDARGDTNVSTPVHTDGRATPLGDTQRDSNNDGEGGGEEASDTSPEQALSSPPEPTGCATAAGAPLQASNASGGSPRSPEAPPGASASVISRTGGAEDEMDAEEDVGLFVEPRLSYSDHLFCIVLLRRHDGARILSGLAN
jgi:hypothetical protein